jgi:hypothetical protein
VGLESRREEKRTEHRILLRKFQKIFNSKTENLGDEHED